MNLVSLCFFAPLQFTVHYSTESGLFLDPDTNEGEVLTYPSGSLHDSSERWIKEVDLTDKTGIDGRGSIICDMSAGILDWDLLYLPPADLISQLSCLQEAQGRARVVYPRASHWPTFCDTFLMFIHMQQFLKTPWVIVEILQRLWNKHQHWSSWPTRCQYHTIEQLH